jgi:type III secretory pathway component EscV
MPALAAPDEDAMSRKVKKMKGNHLKPMLLGGAAILALLLVAGVPFSAALTYAAVLACPLMMVAMVLMMNRGSAHKDASPDKRSDDGNPKAIDTTAGS